MNNRINQGIENNKGSTLSFVLIISMVLMVMVASIMTVANSGFTFTQETVESRQAYIDAKSVIEFGKVQINSRMKALDEKNNKIAAEANLGHSTTVLEEERAVIINELVGPFKIYGDKSNVTETLSDEDISATDDIILLGQVDKTIDQYKFTITTKELRRKLDYQVDYTYVPTIVTPGIEPLTPPGLPIIPQYNTSGYLKTQIKNSGGTVSANIQSQGEDKPEENGVLTLSYPELNIDISKKFDWINQKKLDLTANNICVTLPLPTDGVNGASFFMTAIRNAGNPGQIRFEENYNQVNENKNTLNADNIVFMGDLVIDESSYLEINCVNLWVKGNISIKTNLTAPAAFINRITATNIIVGGKLPNNKTISISNNSRVVWKYSNFLLNDVVNTTFTNAGSPGETGSIVTPGSVKLNNGSEKYY
ncbi:MAG: hypothetical protein JJE18_05495 [Eubacteriaceae bacterium]|nr:hypothetical protein [Eubacteriaceae bacterium]